MNAQRGDIVKIAARNDDMLWVVADVFGSARGEPKDARLVRRGEGVMVSFVTSLAALAVIERPEFAPGERVSINDLSGEVIETAGEFVRVRLDARSKPLEGGFSLRIEEAEANVPLWQLAQENRP